MHRVLVLTSTFPRWENDTEPRFVLDLCRHLAPSASILVIAPDAPGAKIREELEGIPVHRFRYFPRAWQALAYQGGIVARLREKPWRIIQLPFFLCALYRATRRAIRDHQPDLLHAHWLIPQGLAACMAARGRYPVLCTSHGGDLLGLQNAPFRCLKSWVLRRCCAVTVVGEAMVARVRKLGTDTPVEVVPMGTDLGSLFVPPATPGSRSDNELLFAGRLVPGKGVEQLLDALALVAETHGKVRLKIAGDGPLMESLRSRAAVLALADRVEFLGSVPHRQLADLYRAATIAVFPFVVEQGFGLVLTEAMGCGCPVIASDLPATRQTIEPGVSGLLTPPGDSRRLAEAINQCLSDRSMRERMAATALTSVRNRFDWPVIAASYLRIIASCQ